MNAANWLIIFLFTFFLAFIVYRVFRLVRPKLHFITWFVFVACISVLMVFYCLFTHGFIKSVARGPMRLELLGITYSAYLFFIATSIVTLPVAIFVFIVTSI